MSLFNQIIGAVTGGGGEGASGVPGALMSLLSGEGGAGGLGGLMEKFQSAGLGETMQSWIGTGENQPIAPDALQGALGSDLVQKLVGMTGIQPDQLMAQVSEHLPKLIDGLTPNGEMPSAGGLLEAGAALLKSRFGIG